MLEQQDKEDLQYILQHMYPDATAFETQAPTVQTMEIFLHALKSNLFCNNAVTELATGLIAGPGGRLYRGPMKRTVRKILKKVRDAHRERGLSFMICNQIVKLKYRSPLTLSLEGNPGAAAFGQAPTSALLITAQQLTS